MPQSRPVQAVLITPVGRGAVATIRVEGAGATKIVGGLFHPAAGRHLSAFPVGRIVFGRWGGEQGEEMVVCRRAQEQIELHCHGGDAAAEAILEALAEAGCAVVGWRDWLAMHHGDRCQAEAAEALAHARTERTAAILLDQYCGAWRAAIEATTAVLECGQAAEAGRRLRELLDRAEIGRHLTEPYCVVLAGRPNVGKSSLINALVGYRRAIVYDEPGTTRDVLTAATALDGWPVELADTAGLRTGGDALEVAGVERAQQQLDRADCVVLVFDASGPWSADDEALLAARSDALVVHNKCDLPVVDAEKRPVGLHTSALQEQGIDGLVEAIASRLVSDPPAAGAAVPFTAAQVSRLEQALAAVERGELSDALAVLKAMAAR